VFRSKKYLASLLAATFVLLAPVQAFADQGKLACPASKSDAKFVGKLRVAGLATQIPSVQWGIDNGCFKKYGISIQSEVVATSQIATAGLNAPPDIAPPNNTPIAKALPIANQFPVAKITNTRNIVPKNSTKYLFI
jgi:hypothetical protein